MSRRLTLVIPSLAGGGAERVLAGMARHWAERGEHVTLITLAGQEADAYPLAPGVSRIALGMAQTSSHLGAALLNNGRRIRRLRQAIQASRPQAIISFIEQINILTLFATRGLNVPVVIAERADPRRHDIGRLWSALRRISYPWCDALVVQTENARESCRPFAGRRTPISVIPNAVSRPVVAEASFARTSGRYRIVALGRLSPEKGLDLLIRAFAPLAAQFGNWDVEILGEGPQRSELQGLIEQTGLHGRVHLRGWVAEPWKELSGAELFVLPSRFEGFPNALLEAMACGLPVVSFDCDSGPGVIIRNGIDGILVPCEDVNALTAALSRLLADPEERRRLAERAVDVVERFSPDVFFERWEAVLAAVGCPAADVSTHSEPRSAQNAET